MPTVGLAASVPKKVPVPSAWKLHSRYAPIVPAPAANRASETRARSPAGTNATSLNIAAGLSGRSGFTLVSPSREARPSLMPPAQLSNAV